MAIGLTVAPLALRPSRPGVIPRDFNPSLFSRGAFQAVGRFVDTQRKLLVMRRFRLEVVSPEHFPDPEGVLARDLGEATREAARLGAALIRDYPEAFDKPGPWRMRIIDEVGQVLAELDLRAGARLMAEDMGTASTLTILPGADLGARTLAGGQPDLGQRSRKKH